MHAVAIFSAGCHRVVRMQVASMLEAAGFSRSNPYNIVPQGKVMMLTTMKDEQRLDLVKDIAGTRLYDMRRDEVRPHVDSRTP